MNRRKFLAYVSSVPIVASDLMANSGDFYLSRDEFQLIISIRNRLKRVRRHVGYAHFNLISYQDTLFYARNYSSIGAFTKQELAFIDRLFYEDPSKYGFYGTKTCNHIENKISRKDVDKIPHTGHYLFKGKPQRDYKNVLNDVGNTVGDTLKLTSGIRNVIKQLSLYVGKIYNTGGNMTKATISIAPPSYSYHTVSDFDVGRKDWGYKNFTADFAHTQEFAEMTKLNYIGMRYEKNNKDGVRFEPWHVEVI